jgi:hypothetical protein
LLEASIELVPEPTVLRVARRFVDETLTDWGLEPLCDDARLITSELSANAMLHARTDFRVTLRSEGLGHLRIEVRDGTGRMSSPAAPRQDATSGRGLVLVGDLATSWGTRSDGDGKVVWAELRSSGPGGGRAPRPHPLALEDK